MGNVFDEAAAALVDDENLGIDAVWMSHSGGPSRTIRVVSSRVTADAFGPAPAQGERARCWMTATALPGSPERGDLLAFRERNDIAPPGDYRIERVEGESPLDGYTVTLVKA
ncbi:head-tail joining protein [Falsiroseomonas tokyonensis]|uniref:Uncharacterized protein n=1 Tax=Falsiroseomonas tokyonensis TaxID=430521 RepID=A0ABV7BYW1_9PROT|nr:hypothetical protein [Falsiroseomonas tokyonensis]MBU8540819.1 hypothetical protein [Falsiroseomonas tokyonensis]